MSKENNQPEPTFREWEKFWESELVLMELGDQRKYRVTSDAFERARKLVSENSQYSSEYQLSLENASKAIRNAYKEPSYIKEMLNSFNLDFSDSHAYGRGMESLDMLERLREKQRLENARKVVTSFKAKYGDERYHRRVLERDTLGPKSRGLHKPKQVMQAL